VNRAEDLLRDMANLYASMASYADSGAVHTKLDASGLPYSQSFSTVFKRPALFRFEFWRPHPYERLRSLVTRHVAGFDGRAAYFVTQRPDAAPVREERPSLSTAVAGATGISGGSAHTIARLLLPDVGGLSILDLVGASFNPERPTIDGIACHSVTAQHPQSGAPTEFWIEKDSLLLRKVVKHYRLPSEEVRECIHVGELLDDSLFQPP
jgi:hypothetical protein